MDAFAFFSVAEFVAVVTAAAGDCSSRHWGHRYYGAGGGGARRVSVGPMGRLSFLTSSRGWRERLYVQWLQMSVAVIDTDLV